MQTLGSQYNFYVLTVAYCLLISHLIIEDSIIILNSKLDFSPEQLSLLFTIDIQSPILTMLERLRERSKSLHLTVNTQVAKNSTPTRLPELVRDQSSADTVATTSILKSGKTKL